LFKGKQYFPHPTLVRWVVLVILLGALHSRGPDYICVAPAVAAADTSVTPWDSLTFHEYARVALAALLSVVADNLDNLFFGRVLSDSVGALGVSALLVSILRLMSAGSLVANELEARTSAVVEIAVVFVCTSATPAFFHHTTTDSALLEDSSSWSRSGYSRGLGSVGLDDRILGGVLVGSISREFLGDGGKRSGGRGLYTSSILACNQKNRLHFIGSVFFSNGSGRVRAAFVDEACVTVLGETHGEVGAAFDSGAYLFAVAYRADTTDTSGEALVSVPARFTGGESLGYIGVISFKIRYGVILVSSGADALGVGLGNVGFRLVDLVAVANLGGGGVTRLVDEACVAVLSKTH